MLATMQMTFFLSLAKMVCGSLLLFTYMSQYIEHRDKRQSEERARRKGQRKDKKRKEHPKKRKKLGIVAWSAFLQTFFCSHCPSTCHQNTQQELNKEHIIIHDHIFKKGTAHTSGTKQTTQNKTHNSVHIVKRDRAQHNKIFKNVHISSKTRKTSGTKQKSTICHQNRQHKTEHITT